MSLDSVTWKQLGRGPYWAKYIAALKRGHTIRTRVYVMDVNETASKTWDVSKHVTSGQVDIDTSTEPWRQLAVTILDPNNRIAITDPGASGYGGLWAGSLIQVWYDVMVTDLGADGSWVEWPVFTGPVQSLEREGPEVSLHAFGKEAFMLPPSAYENVFSKARIVQLSNGRQQALAALLEAVGEPQSLEWQGDQTHLGRKYDPSKSFHKADYKKGFHKADNSYMKLARTIAGDNHEFSFDGSGRPRAVIARKRGVEHDLTGLELTEASDSFDISDVRNRARARVQKNPSHRDTNSNTTWRGDWDTDATYAIDDLVSYSSDTYHAIASSGAADGAPDTTPAKWELFLRDAPAPIIITVRRKPNDPLSAQQLKRGDVARYLDADDASGEFKGVTAARDAADKLLSGYTEDVTLDIIPVPFLEPGDSITVRRRGVGSGTLTFKVNKYSLPLHAGDSMSIGYTRKILDSKHSLVRHHKLKRKHPKKPKAE